MAVPFLEFCHLLPLTTKGSFEKDLVPSPHQERLTISLSNMPGTLQPQQPNGDAPQRRGVYLLTHPRSASNLFQTMMAKQPGYQNSGYKLFDAGFTTLVELDKGKLSEWSEEEQEKLYDSFRVAFGKLEDELDDCAKNVSFPASYFLSNG
jgi:hypothetical protein